MAHGFHLAALRRLVAVGLGIGTLLAGAFTLPAVGKTPASTVVRAALPPGKINHIIVIEFENEGYGTTFGPGSAATYLNGTLRPQGELLQNYYGIGHYSLDNYIAQVSGQAPTEDTQADCADNGFTFANVEPGISDPNQTVNPGQVDGEGCVYPSKVNTIANQLDAKYPPNPKTSVASWRAYEQDMGNTPSRDGGVADPTGGTDCGHPALGAPDNAEFATALDQYTSRHDPFVWFDSIIDNAVECDANVVPLGTLSLNGVPAPNGHLARDLHSEKTTPRFAFITPNLCSDGHPSTPAYAAACCNEPTGPNTHAPGNAGLASDTAPGGGQVGALLLNPKYVTAGSTDTTGSYNHYSALRSYEDLLGLTTGGADGEGHLGFAASKGLAPFGTDVFSSAAAAMARKHE